MGRLNGVRIRRSFNSQEEVAAEKFDLQLKALQLVAALQSIHATLPNEQVRDAEAVFRRIAGRATRSCCTSNMGLLITGKELVARDIAVATDGDACDGADFLSV